MRWLLVLCAVGLMGCPPPEQEPQPSDVHLVQMTGAPPTLNAELNGADAVRRIVLSPGVAMAVSCWDYCGAAMTGCQGVTVTTDDDVVLDVWPAYRPSGSPVFVLTGRDRGATSVTVRTACGTKSYQAVVE